MAALTRLQVLATPREAGKADHACLQSQRAVRPGNPQLVQGFVFERMAAIARDRRMRALERIAGLGVLLEGEKRRRKAQLAVTILTGHDAGRAFGELAEVRVRVTIAALLERKARAL